MNFPTYEEWLPGYLARQEARTKRRKQMIAAIRLRKMLNEVPNTTPERKRTDDHARA